MSIATDLEAAKVALAALIKAKAEGAADLSEFYNRRLGALGITPADSLEKLIGLMAKIDAQISRESGGTYDTTVLL